NVRTPNASLAASIDADSLSLMGFAFDTANVRLTYRSSAGHVEVALVEGQRRHYSAKGDYALFPDRRQLRLADMRFRFDTISWSLVRPSLIAWGDAGVRVTDLELRNRGNGRIYASGLLPSSGNADFRFEVDEFPVSNIVDISQTDLVMDGMLMVRGAMTG